MGGVGTILQDQEVPVRANCLSDSRVKGCNAFATLEGLLAHLL